MAAIDRYDDPLSVASIKLKMLELESLTRRAEPLYNNKYAAAHLEEANLLIRQAIVQMKYAGFADHRGDVRNDLPS